MALTKKFKLTLATVGLAIVAIIGYVAHKNGYLDTTKLKESSTVERFSLPEGVSAEATMGVQPITPPTNTESGIDVPTWTMGMMTWNSQMPIMYANGGPITTKGSLLEKQGVKLKLERQDNCFSGYTGLINFAKAYKENQNTTEGYQFYNVMGDGVAAAVAGINSELKNAGLGQEYRAFILPYSVGRSDGEDALWGPEEWLNNKKAMLGSVIVTVPRDGDWNIVVQLCMANNLKFNWNEGTYDPDAVNIWAVDDFVKAGEVIITGQTAEWPVIKNGKRTGTKVVKPDGFSSWTPVDVNVVEAVGGFQRIVSTKDYDSQMPNVMITIKKFAQDNRKEIVKMLVAFAEAGDQIKAFPDALKKASEISQKVYQEQTASYWMSLYKGRKQEDAQGNMVEVGGSKAFNLADNLEYYGRNDGSINVYKKVYETFGNIVVKNYPELVPSIEPYASITDISILDEVKEMAMFGDNSAQFMANAELPNFDESKKITNVVSNANYQINFMTGSAEFTPQAHEQLNKILNDALIGKSLRIQINGHTDNTGSPEINVNLSEQRANAVKNWLYSQAPNLFKGNRVTVQGFGQDKPVASNNTSAGRSQNRRVEVVMGNAE